MHNIIAIPVFLSPNTLPSIIIMALNNARKIPMINPVFFIIFTFSIVSDL